jgi:5-methylthioadenosine/S-adenosylhomocysteine deaminase
MYFYPNIVAETAFKQGIRSQICFPILDFPSSWAADADSYIHKGIELIDRYKRSDYIHVAFGPHAPYTVSDAPLKKILTLSAQLDVNVQIHLHETAFEVEDAIARTGKRPLQRLHDLGLMSPALQCVHMTQLDDADRRLVAETGTHIIHCPESNLKLASGYCPVQKLLDAGVNVALGTDGAASNNNLDMIAEMKTAALIGKALAANASAVPAAVALSMATINGAAAMGLAAQTGSLEVGKWADIIAIDFSAVHHQPIYDPISHIVYSASGSDVSHSWIGGKLHMQEKSLTKIDVRHLKARVLEWAEKIRQA